MTFETLITILIIDTWIHDNLCYLTIKSDTGQHLQFLRCFGYVYYAHLNSLGWQFCDISCILISDSSRLQAIIVGGSQQVRGSLPWQGEGSHSKVSCLPPVQDFYKEFLPTSFLWGEYILTLLRTISLHNAHTEHCSIPKIRILRAYCTLTTLCSPSHTSQW